MDKRTVIGIILIVIITLLIPYYQQLIIGKKPISQQQKIQENRVDSLPLPTNSDSIPLQQVEEILPAEKEQTVEADTIIQKNLPILQGAIETERIFLKTNLIEAVITSESGANFQNWKLLSYQHYTGGPVDLASDNGIDVEITNKDGKILHLNEFNLYPAQTNPDTIILSEDNPTVTLEYYLPIETGKIRKKMTFYYDRYSYDVEITFENLYNYIINRRYYFNWFNGLPATEKNISEDFSYARAYAYMAGELEDLDVSKEKTEKKELNGRVDWAAIRTKYFLTSIIPHKPERVEGVVLNGEGRKENGIIHKYYSLSLESPYEPTKSYRDSFQVYLGPLDYTILKKYDLGLEKLVMNKDWYERLFRPISLIVLISFKFLHNFIPNYGWVIILFSILIKLLLYPLTKKSYQSMSEMQILQPKIAALREKYKNDPQRLNKEIMRLYKEHGVNPMGGCLPTLLQMPLLFALFIVFRSTIQLRGQPFILWITDLSQPDALNIGIHLPIFGDSIHVLPILMALTMIWQSRMTITDPKQKMMVYFMPLFMMFIFYNLSSGLNLYYTVFNLLSMIQTNLIKKKMEPVEAQEDSKKEPVKKNIRKKK